MGTAGEPARATVFVEHNALACRPGTEAAFAAGIVAAAGERGGFDVLRLDGFDPAAAAPFTARGDWVERSDHAPVADLAAVRAAGGELAAVLVPRRRQRARRAARDLQDAEGQWCDDPAELPALLEELAVLNRARWAAEGRHTAFEDPRFTAFVGDLALRLAAEGRAWIFRLRRDGTTLASLCCLAHGDRVTFYQSGVAVQDGLRPGIAAHVRCIEACAARGWGLYDFGAPPDRYKVELATAEHPLVWASRERRTVAGALRRAARAARRPRPAGA